MSLASEHIRTNRPTTWCALRNDRPCSTIASTKDTAVVKPSPADSNMRSRLRISVSISGVISAAISATRLTALSAIRGPLSLMSKAVPPVSPLSTSSTAPNEAVSSPVRALIISSEYGFFFCGMMLLLAANAPSSSINENS